jgi:phenylacetate-coenzyme A ligase PaaK-like adenylate-forming protein
MEDVYELTQSLLTSGATRIRQIGEMLGSYAGEPHDSLYSLQRYCRRISVQLDSSAKGISSFDELTRYEQPNQSTVALTQKEEFTAPDTTARYYFRSGGSSGKPKLSTFSLDQYDDDMRFGAEGIYSAGLDPFHDRTMNLFFAGGLYGGFLSIFSALERLGAIQFPMAAHPDLEMVAQTIVDQKVNTLLGMPSYLMSLFEKNSALFEKYRGIKKIFYGGEHFTGAQREYLMKRFGVEVIRSGAYGSVDIGPMGYQCQHCEDGVHHLQQKLHFLEILKMESDEPVVGEEIGRLVYSPRDPGSNKPKRYVIGDVGHWVHDAKGHCPCGRSAPKFKLLGRTGDIFRIGSFFLNYQKFAQILSTHAGYTGDLQIRLLEDGLKEKIELRFGQSSQAAAEDFKKICLQHYADLSEAVIKDQLLQFEVKPVLVEEFERSKASGKLLRIIDQRRRE